MSPKRLPGSTQAGAWHVERDGPVSPSPALQVPFDVAAPSHSFSPYHLGTNMPLYAPCVTAGIKPRGANLAQPPIVPELVLPILTDPQVPRSV